MRRPDGNYGAPEATGNRRPGVRPSNPGVLKIKGNDGVGSRVDGPGRGLGKKQGVIINPDSQFRNPKGLKGFTSNYPRSRTIFVDLSASQKRDIDLERLALLIIFLSDVLVGRPNRRLSTSEASDTPPQDSIRKGEGEMHRSPLYCFLGFSEFDFSLVVERPNLILVNGIA